MATVCSNPPEGRKRWTLDLLAGQMVQLTEHDEGCRARRSAGVWPRLYIDLKPWLHKMWCIPEVNGEILMSPVWRMCSTFMPKRPIPQASGGLLLDESPTQLIGEVREPILKRRLVSRSATIANTSENGTANLFVFLDAHKPWRHVKVRTGPPNSARLRPLHARSRRYTLRGGRPHPRSAGQSFNPHCRRVV